MSRLQELFQPSHGGSDTLEELRARFDLFRDLLDRNNHVLRIIGDMEEKAQGEFLFDLAYIRHNLDILRGTVREIIQLLVDLGGEQYRVLFDRVERIDEQIAAILPGFRPLEPGPFIQLLNQVDSTSAGTVGGKNAQLGEMMRLGLNVPRGFAITAWAYRHFLEANRLQALIDETLEGLNIRHHGDLVAASERIQREILAAEVPEDLAEAILEAAAPCVNRSQTGCCALRSSAIGEDALFSFAGQYSSFLNVSGVQLLDRYRDIIASKFTPRALFYLLSHSLEEHDLAMSVGCTEMVDADASGVLYTRDPLAPEDETVLIHAIFGLGSYLVEGTITPDVFKLRRDRAEVLERILCAKPKRLVADPDGGTREEEVPAEERSLPAIGDRTLFALVDIAVRLEEHYGRPMDIEWAVERGTGRVVVLQARPLRMICDLPVAEAESVAEKTPLLEGGTTVCPGAGGGPVAVIRTVEELGGVREGSVLVTSTPFPALVETFGRISALVTEIGSSASHLAALAREKRVPTLVGVNHALITLEPGRVVTVDATRGAVYNGYLDDLVKIRRPEYDLFEDTAIFDILRRLLDVIAPLNLVSPTDPDFRPERCMTHHDITRFAHQRGIEEVFKVARAVGERRDAGAMLKTRLPLPVHVLDLDAVAPDGSQPWSDENEIPPGPFQAFWEGMLQEGWPLHLPEPNRFIPVSASSGGNPLPSQFTENSFAVIGRDYALVSLRLGFHFTSVEAMACGEAEKNFVRMHYKGGGAAVDRRQRRIRLLAELLGRMGFEHIIKSDFIDSVMTFRGREEILATLNRLGHLTLMTKQLDMALSNERVTSWYQEDFAKRLNLHHERAFPL